MTQLPPNTLANISPPDRTGYEFFRCWKQYPLDPTADFNPVNAWRLAELSLLSYDKSAAIGRNLKAMTGFSGYLRGSTQTQHLVVRGTDDVIVAFRGTEIDNLVGGVSDWLNDLDIKRTADEFGIDIHEGFTRALDRVWNELFEELREITSGKNVRVWFTGHSLGAALATLAAYRAERAGAFRVHCVYTYGSPKVGGPEFRDQLERMGLAQRIYRVRNNHDIVTRVPLSDYTHVGSSQFIDGSGTLHLNHEPIEEKTPVALVAIQEVFKLIPSLGATAREERIIDGPIADHSGTAYAIHLLNHVKPAGDLSSGGTGRRRGMKPAGMVGWFDPGQLLKTAGDVVVSTILGRHADRRLLEPLTAAGSRTIYDHRHTDDGTPLNSLTLDYISDTGDGWNSSYAVLYWATRPELRLDADITTERGSVLVLGGDEVYPVASREEYERRLLKPMEAAMGRTNPPCPSVYAVPGNHDWYDSLASFTRLFISRSWVAGWKSQQDRSYFALQLPHGWWLVSTDVGLESDIDDAQLEFLKTIASKIPETDGVILCNAEPFWVKEEEYNRQDINLQLIENLLGRRVRVFLAGDLHHYRRHALAADSTQKITAGGGGAFLHPTHGWAHKDLAGGFNLESAFPPEGVSKKLARKNLLFFRQNSSFGALTAVLYVLVAWSFMADLSQYPFGIQSIIPALQCTFERGLQESLAAFWTTVIIAGFYFFTETSSKSYRLFAGIAHAGAHLTGCFLLGWIGALTAKSLFAAKFGTVRYQMVSGAVLAAGGYFVGSMLMGLYLYISLNVFGRHRNEAFSALKIEDWKSFLRLRIDEAGLLWIYPIGIRRVPRKWKTADTDDPTAPLFIPDDSRTTEPELIEQPVVVAKPQPLNKP